MRWWSVVMGMACGLVSVPALAQPDGAGDADDSATSDTPAVEATEATAEPAEPTPEQRQEASARFTRGLKFYREREFELALIEFERAYATIPDYRVLYNIGQVCVELGRYARARGAFEKYLAEGGDAIAPERVEEVEADLEMLDGRTAFLVIGTNVEGASVLIDGLPVGRAPLVDALIVDAGEHEVEIRHPGYSGVPQRVTLAGGDRLEVTLELAPLIKEAPRSAPPPEPPTVTSPEPPVADPEVEGEKSSTGLWVGWATTAALGIGAGTTFALGLSAVSEYDEMDGRTDLSENDLPDQKRKVNNLMLTTDVLATSAVVAGGVSLYLTLRQRRPQREHAGRPRAWLEVGPNRAAVVGSF
jgi:hypothetical protein